MNNISVIRYENLLLLITQFKNGAEFGSKVGMSDSQLWQLKNRNTDGTFYRSIGEKVARNIERKLGLTFGWMDTAQSSVNLPENPAGTPTTVVAILPHASGIQNAVLDTARRLIEGEMLNDVDCLALLQTWQPLVAKLEASKNL